MYACTYSVHTPYIQGWLWRKIVLYLKVFPRYLSGGATEMDTTDTWWC